MTSVLSPVLSENSPHKQTSGLGLSEAQPLAKQDTKEYLADMLKELSAIAGWADLPRARLHIDAALREIEKTIERQ
jgi:hypothetical protein